MKQESHRRWEYPDVTILAGSDTRGGPCWPDLGPAELAFLAKIPARDIPGLRIGKPGKHLTLRDLVGHPREHEVDPAELIAAELPGSTSLRSLLRTVDYSAPADHRLCHGLAALLTPRLWVIAQWLQDLDGHTPECLSLVPGLDDPGCTHRDGEAVLRVQADRLRVGKDCAAGMNWLALRLILHEAYRNARGADLHVVADRTPDRALLLTCYDTGPGMAPEEWERFPGQDHGFLNSFLARHITHDVHFGARVDGAIRWWSPPSDLHLWAAPGPVGEIGDFGCFFRLTLPL